MPLSSAVSSASETEVTRLGTLLDSDVGSMPRRDLLKFIAKRGIRRLTFHYAGFDGELHEMRIPVLDPAQTERTLSYGERVDGSSLFRGVIGAEDSDLYVVPVYRSAFLNPFDAHSLDFMCRLLDRDGERLATAPDLIVERSAQLFAERTGAEIRCMAELEFFLLGPPTPPWYVTSVTGGYHAQSPYSRYGEIVDEMVEHLAAVTGAVKYSHAEAGSIQALDSDCDALAGKRGEQHEIEFLPRSPAEMADVVALARWIVRTVAFRHGLIATFAPKLRQGIPGNGLHCHIEIFKGNDSAMIDPRGGLSDVSLQLIGGLMKHASTLCALGNTRATSYLRLVPGQEAPTQVCWGESDRKALVRVPLGWGGRTGLAAVVNPFETDPSPSTEGVQTIEWRLSDGSAHIYLLLAGICLAATWGLTQPDSLPLADLTRVASRSSFPQAVEGLSPLPSDVTEAARMLLQHRNLYEDVGLFPPQVIDHFARQLIEEGAVHGPDSLVNIEATSPAARSMMDQEVLRT
jgi:glutamine synthetase